MELTDTLLEMFHESLPLQLDFYHLGTIEQASSRSETPDFTGFTAVSYQLYGDVSALVIVLFEADLDSSVYSEFGNLLASKISTHLSSMRQKTTWTSPPHIVNTELMTRILRQTPYIRKTYQHFYKNNVILLETLILPTSQEGAGNA